MADYSLAPVDHQPDFGDVSLVPVDHDPFGDDGTTQQAQAQPVQIQPQPMQPASPPQQPATGANQPALGAPAIGNSPGGSPGAVGPSPGEGNVGASPNPTSDQSAPEPLPFNGFANPSLAESLVNQQKMKVQSDLADADRTGGHGAINDGGDLYGFVTTGPTRQYPTMDQSGSVIMATSPFYAKQGSRYAFIEASPAQPLVITIQEDGKFTIRRP